MKISKQPHGNHIYAFEFQYQRHIVEKLQALKDDPNGSDLIYKNNAWRFTDLGWVNKIKNALWDYWIEIHGEVTNDLNKYALKKEDEFKRLNKLYTLKNTLESDYTINNIKGDPWPFQRVGVEFIEATGGRCIIADEMGSGKTMQTLCYIAHNNLKKAVVVCPAIAKGVWYNETLKWTNLKPYILNGKSNLTMDIWQNHDIFIINYDIIGVRVSRKDKNVKRNKFCEFFNSVKIDLLVADECHRIKNPDSARTKSVTDISRRIPRFIGLSGTPLLNRPIELYKTLNILDPQKWNNYYSFAKRYCQKDGKKDKTVYKKDKITGKAKKIKVVEKDGASNIDELRRQIGCYYIRRTKDQILPFLPEKVETMIDIEFDPKTAKLYKATEQGFIDSVNDGSAVGANGFTMINELRQISALGKIEKVTEFIEDMKQDQKVIVFCSFNEPLRQLRDYFGNECVYVTGETNSEDKTALAKKFCEDPSVRVFLGGTISAGESLTLVEARSTIFIDYPWVPGQKDQASDRNHRPGAEKLHDSLNIYQMYTSGTVDERMRSIIYSKKQIFDALFAKDPTKAQKSAKQAVIDSYKTRP
jgi:SWI/SNF-related matrix-associated actin-dependent regulator 1 of chromatin subfamily A